jgi:hypothetical protein
MSTYFMVINPHGLGSTVTATPSDCIVIIYLREGRLGCSGQIVASGTLDFSSATDKGEPAHAYGKRGPHSHTVFIRAEMCLDLKSDADNKFGDLTICVTTSFTSAREAVQNANKAAEQLGTGLAMANNIIQAAATPLAPEITAQFNAWQPLLSCLAAVVKVADTVAKACFIPNYLFPTITEDYLQAGPPLDQVSMGCGLSSI